MKRLLFISLIMICSFVRAFEEQSIWIPDPNLKWSIQFDGMLVQKNEYQMYVIDLFDTPQEVIANLKAQRKKVVCYFSAGSFENWRPDTSNFPTEVLGKDLDGWPGEKWLDIRQTTALKPIMQKRIQLARTKGCDAVDPDNVNGYTNESGFPLEYHHQIEYNRMLAHIAHQNGLSIGLKNDLEQIHDLVDDFDFAINESCLVYNECHRLLPFRQKGKAVFQIEYKGELKNICQKSRHFGFNTIKKHRNLDGWVQSCIDLE